VGYFYVPFSSAPWEPVGPTISKEARQVVRCPKCAELEALSPPSHHSRSPEKLERPNWEETG
jgi:hypothetical protein